MFLTKQLIYHLTDNSVEKLKVILIKRLLDNIIYGSYHQNADFYDLPCDGHEGLLLDE